MVENVKILHSVGEKIAEKLPEVLGWSVTATLAIIVQMTLIEFINGVLQTVVLIISIAVGIATYIYTRRKTKKLDHGNDRT